MTLETDESDSLPNSVADELRGMIVRGTLLPGEHLGQTHLAKQFGRSKVPIREALKRLSTEGFLQHDRNRGYFVSPLVYEEAAQLYKLRRWLEAELLQTARWPEPGEIQAFRARFDEMETFDQRTDFQGWSRKLEELRYAIFDLSPEKVLLREATRLWTLTDRYRILFSRTEKTSPERSLIDALEKRDREGLLAGYFAARDQVEAMLNQVFNDVRAD